MQVIATYSSSEYVITVFSESENEDLMNYRVRLFLTYSGIMSYVGNEGKGLTVIDKPGVLYDDWNCAFRPPRIDPPNANAHQFNCELVVPIDIGENIITLETNGNVISGESILETDTVNPSNILVEEIDPSSFVDVSVITVDGNRVTVTTNVPHGYTKGDAITIDNSDYDGKHVLGPDGLRILGTFKIVSVTETSFTYVTEHYIKPESTRTIICGSEWKCGKWTAVVYEDANIQVSNKDNDQSRGIIVLDYGNDYPTYLSNDYINLGTKEQKDQVQVARVIEHMVEIDNRAVEESGVITVYRSPRTPSAAIPTNWYFKPPIEPYLAEQVSNPSQYDHTANTYFVSPYLDTYFTKNDPIIHNSERILKCSGGENPSIICLKFCIESSNITMEAAYSQTAILRMYVSKMSYSESTVSLYQMDSNGWREDMSYDEVLEHVTQIPVASAEITNPALKDINRANYTPVLGSYNNYVDFVIDPFILCQWLSGNTAYLPTVCMKMLSLGNSVIEFNSTASRELVPYFIVSGGEDALLGQKTFDITVENPSTEPGKIIRVDVDDADASFGNTLYDNIIKINEIPATIMNGSPYYIDVVVPDTVAGVSQVQVYKKVRNKEVVLTNPTNIYVNNDLMKRDIKIADKKNPGEISGKTSRSAIYNRDLGYSNFKEVTDETSLLQNVYSCLLTSQGERLFNQNFGSHIEDRIFTLGSTTDEVDLLKECIEIVGKYEPRVQIDPERSSCDFDDNGCYNLVLAVILPTARTEMLKFTFKSRGRIV